jgi:glucosamine--fructose-6-phosphate aminotransferase (isomerizing)
LAVAISRSGTTSETVWPHRFCETIAPPVIALTCYADSDLARESNWQMIIPEAQEKSVVMTRSFTAQLLVLSRLGNRRFDQRLDPATGKPSGTR